MTPTSRGQGPPSSMSTKKKVKTTKAKQGKIVEVLHKCPFCDACPHVKEAESKARVVYVPVYAYPPVDQSPPTQFLPQWPGQSIITCCSRQTDVAKPEMPWSYTQP